MITNDGATCTLVAAKHGQWDYPAGCLVASLPSHLAKRVPDDVRDLPAVWYRAKTTLGAVLSVPSDRPHLVGGSGLRFVPASALDGSSHLEHADLLVPGRPHVPPEEWMATYLSVEDLRAAHTDYEQARAEWKRIMSLESKMCEWSWRAGQRSEGVEHITQGGWMGRNTTCVRRVNHPAMGDVYLSWEQMGWYVRGTGEQLAKIPAGNGGPDATQGRSG